MKILILLLLPLQLLSQSKILFKNVNIIDVEKGRVINKQNVLIEGNRIKTISTKVLSEKGVPLIDATDKYLMPGLWDMHVHLFNNVSQRPPNEWYFPLLIANGVIGVREMWAKPSSMHHIIRWRKQFEEHDGIIPRIGAVGTLVDGLPKVWPNSDTVKTPEEGRAFVRSIKNSGIDFVKVYGRLSRETYFAIADESKKLKTPFAGHVPEKVLAIEASNAGQKSIEHLTGTDVNCISGIPGLEKQLTDAQNTNEVILFKNTIDFCDSGKAAAVYKQIAKNKTWQVPTSPIFTTRAKDGDSLETDAQLNYLPKEELDDWKSFSMMRKNRSVSRADTAQMHLKRRMLIVQQMHKAGIRFLAGTDLGNPYIYAGYSLHDDLLFFVSCGLSPGEAIQTATINPAIYLNKQKDLGTVQKGKLADLVLLDANPLLDISNTRKINAVVVNGKLLQRKNLDKLLEEAKEKVRLP